MKTYGAKGFCLKCQKFNTVKDFSDRTEAIIMFVHEHGMDNGHSFEGDIDTFVCDPPVILPKLEVFHEHHKNKRR